MKSRLIASVAVFAAVALGTSGCAMLSPQGTTIPYSPGDGINVAQTQGAPLDVRNALIVATDDGSVGNLIGAIINTTADAHTLNVQVGDGKVLTVDVPADSVSSLGQNVDPLRIDDLGVKPGGTVSVYFQSGQADGAVANVPVMDGQEQYLSSFVPQPEASPTDEPAS